MLKIAVFGIGRGGEAVTRYLSTELNTVEIIKVIDWSNFEGAYSDPEKMRQAAFYFLAPYIGKVDLIVLADYTFSLVINSLKAKWPEQRILGMEVDFHHIPKSCQRADNVTLLANELLLQSELGSKIRQQLHCAGVVLPDCSGWESLIDSGDMSKDILRIELGETFTLTDGHKLRSRPQREKLVKEESLRLEIIGFLMRTNAVTQPCLATAGGEYYQDRVDYNNSIATQHELEQTKQDKLRSPQVVYLLGTHFWTIKRDLQEIFGYRVMVMDFRRKLLHDVCLALKLRGVDGRLGE